MKQHIHKSISLLLALLLCVGLFSAIPARAEEASGKCGENLTWALQDGVLTISGSGAMDNYNEVMVAPWNSYTQQVHRIIIAPGVTSVGRRAFYGMRNLTSVSIPDTVTSLGALAFADCMSLKRISFPGVETIGWGCFYGCTALVNVVLPETLRSIGDQAFYQCSRLAGITIPQSVEEMGVMVFSYCKSLVYVRIQAKLTVLPNWTFYGCVRLWEVYLPSSIATVETNAFGECPSLYYVDYGGSQEVKDEITEQLSQPTTMEPDRNTATDVTYSETENATVTITTGGNSQETGSSNTSTRIDATINDAEGWNDVMEGVVDSLNTGATPDVVVQVQDNLTMGEGVLSGISGEDVTVTVETSDNVSWEIVMQDQTADSMRGDQNFGVSIDRNSADDFQNVLGGAKNFRVTLGSTNLNTTVMFPLGIEHARKIATLYRIDGDDLVKLVSTLVDDGGRAAFSLAGTQAGAYVIALNVSGISMDEVRIPKSLASEYGIDYNNGTLTDMHGNQYIITGTTNELGFGIGTLTWIIVGVLGGSIVVVGVVMFMWNKQQKRSYAQQYRRKK